MLEYAEERDGVSRGDLEKTGWLGREVGRAVDPQGWSKRVWRQIHGGSYSSLSLISYAGS